MVGLTDADCSCRRIWQQHACTQTPERMVKRELHGRRLLFAATTDMCSSVNMTPNMSLSTILQEIGPWSPSVWKLPACRIHAQQRTWLKAYTHCCPTGTWAKENWSAKLQITVQILWLQRGNWDGLGSAVLAVIFTSPLQAVLPLNPEQPMSWVNVKV